MSAFDVAGLPIGGPGLVVMAGPCSISDGGRTLRVAEQIRAPGATMLRGGAFKPRSRVESFQGLGERALEMLAEAKRETGLPVVTELLDVRKLDAVLAVADVIQVGARNMHNTELLKELGQTDRAVLLKRGLAATIEETVGAADYIHAGGNDRVILCERGIRTFERAYRFTLDLTAVPLLREASGGLPVFVDPSHAAGRRDLVPALSKAAVAVGADGLIVEVDEDPDSALSDPEQQLDVADFGAYMDAIRAVAHAEGREVMAAPDPARS